MLFHHFEPFCYDSHIFRDDWAVILSAILSSGHSNLSFLCRALTKMEIKCIWGFDPVAECSTLRPPCYEMDLFASPLGRDNWDWTSSPVDKARGSPFSISFFYTWFSLLSKEDGIHPRCFSKKICSRNRWREPSDGRLIHGLRWSDILSIWGFEPPRKRPKALERAAEVAPKGVHSGTIAFRSII